MDPMLSDADSRPCPRVLCVLLWPYAHLPPSTVPISQVYSLPSSLSLSHLICLSEDHPAWGLEGAPSREAPFGRETRSKYATSRKFVEKCRVGAREDEGPVCVTHSLTLSSKPAVASTRPLF